MTLRLLPSQLERTISRRYKRLDSLHDRLGELRQKRGQLLSGHSPSSRKDKVLPCVHRPPSRARPLGLFVGAHNSKQCTLAHPIPIPIAAVTTGF